MPLPVTNLKPLPIMRDAAGNVLTVHDLPPLKECKHWTASRRQLLIDAVKNNLLTPEELCRRYQLTPKEFDSWRETDTRSYTPPTPADLSPVLKPPSEPAVFGDLTVDFARKRIFIGAARVRLFPRHYAILEFMASHPGQVISVQQFMDLLYRNKLVKPYQKTISVFICQIRKRIAQHSPHTYVHNVWGRGYKLEAPQ